MTKKLYIRNQYVKKKNPIQLFAIRITRYNNNDDNNSVFFYGAHNLSTYKDAQGACIIITPALTPAT